MINYGKLSKSKRRWQPKKGYRCNHCGGNDHYAFACFSKPRKPLKLESDKTKAQRLKTRRVWFKANPPDKNGQWDCYLRIAPDCPKKVTVGNIDLEHVLNKGGHKVLIFRIENIKAACQPCNKLKRSWSLEQLAETYPQIRKLLDDPKFAKYYQSLYDLEAKLTKAKI